MMNEQAKLTINLLEVGTYVTIMTQTQGKLQWFCGMDLIDPEQYQPYAWHQDDYQYSPQ